jgi:mannosyltransferase OCH1-like enzyme
MTFYFVNKYLATRNYNIVKNIIITVDDHDDIHEFTFIPIYVTLKLMELHIIRFDCINDGWSLDLNITIKSVTNDFSFQYNVGSSSDTHKICKVSTEKYFFEKCHYTSTKIPKQIMQTNNSLFVTQQKYNAIQNITLYNPNYKYELFTDYECNTFIRENYDSNVLKAYLSLTSGTLKSDLFRVCYLYIHGGVYFDCKMTLHMSLDEFISSDADFILINCDGNCYYTGFIATIPKNIIIRIFIDKIVELVNEKYYGTYWLNATGPVLWWECMKQIDPTVLASINIQYLKFKSSDISEKESKNKKSSLDNIYIKIGDRFAIRNQYANYYKGIDRFLHYSDIWEIRYMYKVPFLDEIKFDTPNIYIKKNNSEIKLTNQIANIIEFKDNTELYTYLFKYGGIYTDSSINYNFLWKDCNYYGNIVMEMNEKENKKSLKTLIVAGKPFHIFWLFVIYLCNEYPNAKQNTIFNIAYENIKNYNNVRDAAEKYASLIKLMECTVDNLHMTQIILVNANSLECIY